MSIYRSMTKYDYLEQCDPNYLHPDYVPGREQESAERSITPSPTAVCVFEPVPRDQFLASEAEVVDSYYNEAVDDVIQQFPAAEPEALDIQPAIVGENVEDVADVINEQQNFLVDPMDSYVWRACACIIGFVMSYIHMQGSVRVEDRPTKVPVDVILFAAVVAFFKRFIIRFAPVSTQQFLQKVVKFAKAVSWAYLFFRFCMDIYMIEHKFVYQTEAKPDFTFLRNVFEDWTSDMGTLRRVSEDFLELLDEKWYSFADMLFWMALLTVTTIVFPLLNAFAPHAVQEYLHSFKGLVIVLCLVPFSSNWYSLTTYMWWQMFYKMQNAPVVVPFVDHEAVVLARLIHFVSFAFATVIMVTTAIVLLIVNILLLVVYSRSSFQKIIFMVKRRWPWRRQKLWKSTQSNERVERLRTHYDSNKILIEKTECPVCWEVCHHSRILFPCLHHTCTDCGKLQDFQKIDSQCPVCRTVIDDYVDVTGKPFQAKFRVGREIKDWVINWCSGDSGAVGN